MTPPTSEQPVTASTGPITEPKTGTDERTALMDAARSRLGIADKFVVQGLYVQGDRAVGVLNSDGSSSAHLFVWMRRDGTWTVTWNGRPDAAGKAAIEAPELGLSAEVIAKLGL